jgi:hypothetical protein
VREIIGQIGGKPTFMKKIFNIVFVVLVGVAFVISLFAKGRAEVLMLEIIVLLVSAKFIYFLYLQAKVTHFQFWVLSSIEWKLNEAVKNLNELSEKMENVSKDKDSIPIGS